MPLFPPCSPSWHPTWASRIPAVSTICTACPASWAGWLVSWPSLWGRKRGKGLCYSTQVSCLHVALCVYINTHINCTLQLLNNLILQLSVSFQLLQSCLLSSCSSAVTLPCKLPPWLHPSGSLWLEVLLQVGGDEK